MPITRRVPIETKIHHERWLVSYADFITLLFAFFVVMYSISQVSETKYKVLASMLDETFSPSSAQRPVPQDSSIEEPIANLAALQSDLQQALEELVFTGDIVVQGNESWVEVEVNSNLLFSSGSAEPSAQARDIFAKVANILRPYQNAVAVSGHTDDIPIHNAKFQNNWELSAARAVQVVNLLAYDGVAPQRLSAVGYGEFQPIADNATEKGRAENRRVVLRVAKEKAEVPRKSAAAIVRGESPAEVAGENTAQQPSQDQNTGENQPPPIEPVRLRDGGLLFTSDPDLPRNNQ